ncbi:MAG: FAD-binding protein [Proteobacteria bacterium]|nr:FAD-binding protein [Pseudomonadota bacterium]
MTNYNSSNIKTLEFDALIIGGGGSGMRASLELAKSGLKTAVVSKVFPTRSHTVSAQGGITCAIQSADPNDDWRWHMYDTVKGADYIGDQDAIEYLCSEGPKAVFELEHMGLPFSRFENGRIYQRPFGGQSKDYGKGGQAARTCAAADRTGHALLHTLYQNNVKEGTNFLNEWFAVDIVKNAQNEVTGVIAFSIEYGEVAYLKAQSTVMATGGAGRIYASTTNALINTGDGLAMALRAGYPAQDMEMWQFHPTGIYGAGSLVTEGCRGEGGYLINKDGERFMERYAPNVKDLAGRDVVARSMVLEILEGRGCGENNDHIYLKLDHLGADVLNGGNSLLDLVVFGRATGMFIQEDLKSGGGVKSADKDDIDNALDRLNTLNNSDSGYETAEVKKELQQCMQNYFGVFRRGEYMKKGLDELQEIREKVDQLHLKDKSNAFNTSRVEAIELQNLFEVAEATAIAAYSRDESRGAHARDDFPDRDDERWLCHSLYDPLSKTVSKRDVNFNPSEVEAFPPIVRTY